MKVSVQQVRLSELRPGTIRHESFSPELSQRIAATYREIGHYQEPTLEQWELGFMRDANPEGEVAVWEVFAKAFRLFKQKCWKSGRMKRQQAREIISILCLISAAQPLAMIRGNAVLKRQLLQCFRAVGGVATLPIVVSA
jgi:hypothetical protein